MLFVTQIVKEEYFMTQMGKVVNLGRMQQIQKPEQTMQGRKLKTLRCCVGNLVSIKRLLCWC